MPDVIQIDPYNFELYRFKVCAFFLRHSVVSRVVGVRTRGMGGGRLQPR